MTFFASHLGKFSGSIISDNVDLKTALQELETAITSVSQVTPAGTLNEVQFRDGGAFGADSLFVFNSSTDVLGIGIAAPSTFTKIHTHNPIPGGSSNILFTNATTGTGFTDGFYVGYGTDAFILNFESTPLKLYTSGISRVEIAAGGNVGIGTTPSAYGALDISSTTAALIVPRMTTTQRDLMTPAIGMVIFNTSTAEFQGYNGGGWIVF